MLSVVQSDRIHVLSDAAIYDRRTGVLTDLAMKILPLPRANAVFSSRGSAEAFAWFWAACSLTNYEGHDGFRRAADDVWEEFQRIAPGVSCEVMVAGWSDAAGRGEVLYRCAEQIHEGLPPGAWYVLGDVAAFGFDLDVDPASFDPVVDALPAFQHARREVNDLSFGRGEPVWGHGVGGWVSHVVVAPGGEPECETLHMWPDVVGDRIEPDYVARRWEDEVGERLGASVLA
ncbi:hypothetical protein [Roseixanthobacter pseudopolyaromaticivorans]|uniref:hypothetical protein n=1 Tax=Xanthobacteraceae TaxID=335928 RepID=UPI00372ABA3D